MLFRSFVTWETASLPSICMIISGTMFSVRDANETEGSVIARSHLDLFFAILAGKLYALGLLRTLNSRTKFRERLNSTSLGRRSLSGWQWANATGDSATLQDPSAGQEMAGARGSVAESRKDSGPTFPAVHVTKCDAGLPTGADENALPQETDSALAVGSGSGVEVRMTLYAGPSCLLTAFIPPDLSYTPPGNTDIAKAIHSFSFARRTSRVYTELTRAGGFRYNLLWLPTHKCVRLSGPIY